MRKQGNNWSLEYDDSVLIAQFEKGIDFESFGAEAFPAFQEILSVHGDSIVGSANLVAVESKLSPAVGRRCQSVRRTPELPAGGVRRGRNHEGLTQIHTRRARRAQQDVRRLRKRRRMGTTRVSEPGFR